MKTIIEVGANRGQDTINFAQDPNNLIYAFEPIGKLYNKMLGRFKDFPNVHLFNNAVDTEEGEAEFYIANEKGASSLHKFVDNLDDNWKERNFHVRSVIPVKKIRLDNFIKEKQISQIDYLWIDAQGNDFKVLQSLGTYINIVKEGKCEATRIAALYKDTINDVDTIVNWLSERGFTCNVVPLDNEADIHFKKND